VAFSAHAKSAATACQQRLHTITCVMHHGQGKQAITLQPEANINQQCL
jgi:hypothetical protein